MDQYECVKKLGSGNFGVTLLMRHKETGESVAVKQLPRGNKINKNVYREVLNHRKLSHPNVIGFKAVYLDDEHLNIVMEYASGARGDLHLAYLASFTVHGDTDHYMTRLLLQ